MSFAVYGAGWKTVKQEISRPSPDRLHVVMAFMTFAAKILWCVTQMEQTAVGQLAHKHSM